MAALLRAIPPIVTDVTVVWSVRLYVCMLSVTLVHLAKAVGWNDMPFGRDTCVVPSNTVLDSCCSPYVNGWHPHFTAMLPITRLLWPLLCDDDTRTSEMVLQVGQIKRISQLEKLLAPQQCWAADRINHQFCEETAQKEAKKTWLREITVSIFTATAAWPLFQRQKSIAFDCFQFPPKVCKTVLKRVQGLTYCTSLSIVVCVGHTSKSYPFILAIAFLFYEPEMSVSWLMWPRFSRQYIK